MHIDVTAMRSSESSHRVTDHVLIISPYAAHPGHHWKYAEQIALALKREGRQVEILVHDGVVREPAKGIASNINFAPKWWQSVTSLALSIVRKVRPTTRLWQPLETLGVLLRVGYLPKKGRDATIIHCIDATFLIFFVWQLFAQKRCVYNLMGDSAPLQPGSLLPNPFRWLKRTLTRFLLARSLRRGLLEFCAETEAVRRDWETIVGPHVHVIPYAVAPLDRHLSRREARTRLALSAQEAVLLLFGTHRSDKDFATVIRAAKMLSPPPCLLFVGKHISGPSPATLVRDLEFANFKIIDRFVDDTEAVCYFAACDAVLLPYSEGYEKGSTVLLEACQHQRPVIATDTGYLRDFVEEYGTGWLFRFGDADDLVRCIRALKDNPPDERAALHERISTAASHHSWQRIIGLYLGLYETLTKKNVD